MLWEQYKKIIKHGICKIVIGKLALVTMLVLGACQMPSYNPSALPPNSSESTKSSPSSEPTEDSKSSGNKGGATQSSTSNGSSIDISQVTPSGEDPKKNTSNNPLEKLDQALDESLEGFDNSVSGSLNADNVIDILSPSGSSDMQSDNTAPSFEEKLDDMMTEENTDIVQRASPESDPLAAGALPTEKSNTNSSHRSNQGQSSESIPIPEDVGDGRNDNIVQRQIREAAMRETDPVLRNRLWDEYRKISGARK